MDENRTMVTVISGEKEPVHKLSLTDDQLRLLQWLKKNGHINPSSGFYYSQILEEVKPQAI